LRRFKIKITKSAEKDLNNFEPKERLKVLQEIKSLQKFSFPQGTRVKKIKNTRPALYRLRVGDYRVIYRIEEVVIVLAVIHRRELERALRELL